MSYNLVDMLLACAVAALSTAWVIGVYIKRRQTDSDIDAHLYRRAMEQWRDRAESAQREVTRLEGVTARLTERNAMLQRSNDDLRQGYMERTQQALMHNLQRYIVLN